MRSYGFYHYRFGGVEDLEDIEEMPRKKAMAKAKSKAKDFESYRGERKKVAKQKAIKAARKAKAKRNNW